MCNVPHSDLTETRIPCGMDDRHPAAASCFEKAARRLRSLIAPQRYDKQPVLGGVDVLLRAFVREATSLSGRKRSAV